METSEALHAFGVAPIEPTSFRSTTKTSAASACALCHVCIVASHADQVLFRRIAFINVGETMPRNYLDRMLTLVPLGVVGASLLLGSGVAAAAAPRPAAQLWVSERLTAIRDAVLDVVGPTDLSKPVHRNVHLAWGIRWNNWGSAAHGGGTHRGTIGATTSRIGTIFSATGEG